MKCDKDDLMQWSDMLKLGYEPMCYRLLRRRSSITLVHLRTAQLSQHLRFRAATLSDKDEVLGMRQNVYRGLDYLPDYYDFFVKDPNRKCIVGEILGKVICFGVMYIIDDGTSMLSQAGRVHTEYERQGNFKQLSQYCNSAAKEYGCSRRVALVETTLNQYARSERFRKTHKEIATKLHYAGVITKEVRHLIGEAADSMISHINNINNETLERYITDPIQSRYLFPSKCILLDYVPFHAIKENVLLLKGRNVQFFSDVEQSGNDLTGLLSAGSSYKCKNPPRSYTIDISGSDESSIETHLVFHLRRAIILSEEETCLQIFIDKGYMAQELCRVLRKYSVKKCNWYVEGGITVKTIVEEDLVDCSSR